MSKRFGCPLITSYQIVGATVHKRVPSNWRETHMSTEVKWRGGLHRLCPAVVFAAFQIQNSAKFVLKFSAKNCKSTNKSILPIWYGVPSCRNLNTTSSCR